MEGRLKATGVMFVAPGGGDVSIQDIKVSADTDLVDGAAMIRWYDPATTKWSYATIGEDYDLPGGGVLTGLGWGDPDLLEATEKTFGAGEAVMIDINAGYANPKVTVAGQVYTLSTEATVSVPLVEGRLKAVANPMPSGAYLDIQDIKVDADTAFVDGAAMIRWYDPATTKWSYATIGEDYDLPGGGTLSGLGWGDPDLLEATEKTFGPGESVMIDINAGYANPVAIFPNPLAPVTP